VRRGFNRLILGVNRLFDAMKGEKREGQREGNREGHRERERARERAREWGGGGESWDRR
jgi:hypothetical protein